VVPGLPPPPSVKSSFASMHRRVTPMPVHSGDVQRSTTPTSSADLLLSVQAKGNESTTNFSPGALLAAADAVTKAVPRRTYEPSLSRFLQATNLFPAIVYRMIDDVSQDSDGKLMHWNAAGDKFFIDQTSSKLGPILKRYFART
jgi:hypothetical protein